MSIGGNTNVLLQVRVGTTKNSLGEKVPKWHDVCELKGWLDFISGEVRRTSFMANIQESTHVFVGDYQLIPATIDVDGKTVKVTSENTKIVANSQEYIVKYIDDPMGLHRQIEIYLQYTGGQ